MWQLYQFPLCPFSRKVRLLLSEKGVAYELMRENPWEGRDEFLALNPAGRTPVLRNAEKKITLVDSRAICEYFEETTDKAPMIVGTATNRAEIRRLVHERIRNCGHNGGFVLAPANVIMYDTPIDNVLAMYDAAREFRW